MFFKESTIPHQDERGTPILASDRRRNPRAGEGGPLLRFAGRDAEPGGFREHEPPERMRVARLGRGGEPDQLRRRNTRGEHDRAGHLGLAGGECAGLVEGEGVAGGQAFESGAALDDDAVTREPGHRREHRRRGRQDQGAGAGDHQHGHRPPPGVSPANPKSREHRQQRNDLDDRQEVAGVAVGRAFQRRFLLPGRRDEFEHLPEGRLVPDLFGDDLDLAELVDRPREDLVPRPLVYGDRLPGERGLIDRRSPGCHEPVDRDPFPLADPHEVSDEHGRRSDLDFLAVADDPGRPRRLVHQAVNRPLGPGEGQRLQDLAEHRDEYDLGRDERLPEHQRRDARLGQCQVRPDLAVQQPIQGPVDDPGRPEERGDPDQRETERGPPAFQPEPAEDQVEPDQRPEQCGETVQAAVVVGGFIGVVMMRVAAGCLEGVLPHVFEVVGVELAVHVNVSGREPSRDTDLLRTPRVPSRPDPAGWFARGDCLRGGARVSITRPSASAGLALRAQGAGRGRIGS